MLRIGSRGSKLALQQAEWVKGKIEQEHPGLTVGLQKIRTTGDMILDVPLAQVGGKGLFVKEIEEALLQDKIDLAVHSMKDVPTFLPAGLHLGAVTEREDPRDVFISADGTLLKDLLRGAAIGTSSLRRQAQLLHLRPDLNIIPLRGNLDTRIRKLEREGLGGIVLAAAGLKRMGWLGRVTEYLESEVSLPAVGQGALGIECRQADEAAHQGIHFLHDHQTADCVLAERAFLKRLEGGCQVPIAAHARIQGDRVRLEGLVASVDGRRLVRDSLEGGRGEGEALGLRLAEALLSRGADAILKEIYSRSPEQSSPGG